MSPKKDFKYLHFITLWNIFFAIVCIPTTGKMIDVFGTPLSISIFFFPFIYILADILTEVYGYAAARRVLWQNVIAQFAAILVFQFTVSYPPAASFANDSAYGVVLGSAPRFVVFGLIAIFIGDIANNYVLAKMKIWSKGKNIASRFVLSTIVGQTLNTAFFYTFGLWGLLPTESLLQSILLGSLAKTCVEIIMVPVTIRVANWLKKEENEDCYDRTTNFNPLKF